MKPRVVSLFSGGGGLDLGFIDAGFDVIWAIDNNKNAVETYKKNIGYHIIHEDINCYDINNIPNCDVVIGGPPCQSFSLAGKRDNGDERGKLVWKYIEIIEKLKPKIFLFENVVGLLSAKNEKGEKVLELLLSAFSKIGYNLSWEVINAANYGVAQLRKRLIIVGTHQKNIFNFPAHTHSSDTTTGLKRFTSVSDILGDLPLAGSSTFPTDHDIPTMSTLDKYIVEHVKPGGNYNDIPDEVSSERIKRLKKSGGHTTCYGRMHPDKPSYTINTYFNRPNVGCNIHYKYNRLITVREALRIQSFPDNYEIISTSKQGKNLIVGNAVPPMLARALAMQIKKII